MFVWSSILSFCKDYPHSCFLRVEWVNVDFLYFNFFKLIFKNPRYYPSHTSMHLTNVKKDTSLNLILFHTNTIIKLKQFVESKHSTILPKILSNKRFVGHCYTSFSQSSPTPQVDQHCYHVPPPCQCGSSLPSLSPQQHRQSQGSWKDQSLVGPPLLHEHRSDAETVSCPCTFSTQVDGLCSL